jgi:glyoxylase-like metal-dependent hydrolase (beta-lactamase superfamily II)
MINIVEAAENIYMIDDRLHAIPQAGSVYFLDEDKKALVDTGPSTSSEFVIKGIKQIGRKPEDISYIIVTHIHLDHSGGVGTLLNFMPEAEVLVHNRAVRHMINPERLVKSALEAQGEEWMKMTGEVLPVDAHKIKPVYDGDTIVLSERQILTLLETPGHAPHEVCIHESRNNGIFVGDAVAHHVAGTDISVPITPPPNFDLELYINSLNRLMQLNAGRLYFAHFGASERVEEKVNLAINELKIRNGIIAKAAGKNNIDMAADMVIDHIRGVLKPMMAEMKAVFDYWTEFDIPMSAREHVNYYRKKSGSSN